MIDQPLWAEAITASTLFVLIAGIMVLANLGRISVWVKQLPKEQPYNYRRGEQRWPR